MLFLHKFIARKL